MESVRWQAKDYIADLYSLARDDAIALHDADDEPGDVVLPVGIKAGHLCRFPSDQRAAVLPARIRQAGDNFLRHLRIEFAASEVIQKEERSGTLYRDVVHAVVHKIAAHGMVQVHLEGNFELGADSVGA